MSPPDARAQPSDLSASRVRDHTSRGRGEEDIEPVGLSKEPPSSGNAAGNVRSLSGRIAVVPSQQFSRSRVANGNALLPGIDGRSAWARRYRDITQGLTADLGGDLTEAERQQVRAAASLQLHVEQMTARMVRGETVDSDAITRAANGAVRALAALRRRQRPGAKTKSLADRLMAARSGGHQ